MHFKGILCRLGVLSFIFYNTFTIQYTHYRYSRYSNLQNTLHFKIHNLGSTQDMCTRPPPRHTCRKCPHTESDFESILQIKQGSKDRDRESWRELGWCRLVRVIIRHQRGTIKRTVCLVRRATCFVECPTVSMSRQCTQWRFNYFHSLCLYLLHISYNYP